MQSNVSLTDDSIKWVIMMMCDHPVTLAFMLILITVLIICYKERTKILARIALLPIFRKTKTTQKDLLNHQIFKDLEFYTYEKIEQVFDPALHSHTDPVKLAIGKDILKIKLKNSNEWLRDFIFNTDFTDPNLNVRSLLLHRREKNLAVQWCQYKEAGVPTLFLEKFLDVIQLHENYVSRTIDDLLSDKIPMQLYDKLYLVLGTLSSYYSTLMTDMIKVITSINGDLKGITYKDRIIGGNDYRCYPVPDRSYIPLVEEKLEKLATLTKCSRASVLVFHDVDRDDFLNGMFSKIYEYEWSGFKPAFEHFQYRKNALIHEMIPFFKRHEGCKFKTKELNGLFASMLENNGCHALYAFPMFNENHLKGFLLITYHSEEDFDNLDEQAIMQDLKKYGMLLNHYILYKLSGLDYEGNSMKEIANWEQAI